MGVERSDPCRVACRVESPGAVGISCNPLEASCNTMQQAKSSEPCHFKLQAIGGIGKLMVAEEGLEPPTRGL